MLDLIFDMANGFQDHFSGVASGYSEFRPHYPRSLFEALANESANRTLAWDCATGNGQAAIKLAEFFERVVATDASAQQIQHAAAHPKIDYRVSSAEQCGLFSSSVDLVTVAQALHWFDIPAFFAEAKRVLKPGGVLAVWCYGRMSFNHPEIDQEFENFYSHVVGPYWPAERKLIEERYKTIPFPFREFELGSFAIEAEFTLENLGGYLRTWSATQRFEKAKGYNPVPELIARLDKFWQSDKGAQAVYWPLDIRAGRL